MLHRHLLMLLLVCVSAPLGARVLYISSGFTPPLSDLFAAVLAEVDRRADSIEIVFQPMQAERSIKLVQEGVNDGDCCRVPAVFENDERLLFVEPSFASINWNAFVADERIRIDSFEDLAKHTVGVVSGWKLAVNKVREIAPQHYHILDTPEQMFRMLQLKRLDVGVIGYLSGLYILNSLGIEGIHALQPPLAVTPLYLVLAKKQSDLVPEISALLTQMERDGSIAEIQKKLEREFRGY